MNTKKITKEKLLVATIIASVALAMSCIQANQDKNKSVEIAQKVFLHFNNHDWKSMANLYAEPCEFQDPSFGQEKINQTREQIINKYKELERLFPDIKDEVSAIYSSGEKNVTIEFISSATSQDSTKWTLPICTVLTIENGLIIKDHTYYDNL